MILSTVAEEDYSSLVRFNENPTTVNVTERAADNKSITMTVTFNHECV